MENMQPNAPRPVAPGRPAPPRPAGARPAAPRPPKPSTPREPGNTDVAKIIMGVVIVLLLGAVGYLTYDKIAKEGLVAQTKADAEKTVELAKTDIEAKVAEINKLQDSIRIVIAEKEKIGAELSEERAKLADLENLKSQIQHKQVSINSLNKKLSKYKQEYETVKASIESLTAENQKLTEEKASLEQIIKTKDDSLKTLATAQVALSEKVNHAAAFKAQNITIVPQSTGGKDLKTAPTYKAASVGKVKMSVTLADNPMAAHAQKEVYMRFVEPAGATMYEGDSRVFTVNGKRTMYTDKQVIEFDNSQQTVNFLFQRAARYKPGKYIIEFYMDSKKIGSSTLTLTK
jgi:hypothetical protein